MPSRASREPCSNYLLLTSALQHIAFCITALCKLPVVYSIALYDGDVGPFLLWLLQAALTGDGDFVSPTVAQCNVW